MKYKKGMIIIMLTIFLFAIAAASASDVNETVMANEDTGQMELSANDETNPEILAAGQYTYSDLRDQIGSGGDITLTQGTYTYNSDDGDTIQITAPGVIDGNGAVIDMARFNKGAFKVYASGVTFKNLTIKNADLKNNGGAIYFNSSGTVTDSNFINNRAYSGGAIYFAEGTVGTLTNCNFASNAATLGTYGGAVYFRHNGTVANCDFTYNRGQFGAAIYANDGSYCNLTDCNFAHNSANFGYGGGAYFRHSADVANCNFTDNEGGDGGALCFASPGYGNITNCNFINNVATASGSLSNGGAIHFASLGIVTGCNFINNTAMGDGGAVYFYSIGKATSCNFVNNSVTPNIFEHSLGGAAYIKEGTITNCNFTGNSATTGSALYFSHYAGDRIVSNSTFLNNRGGVEAFEVVKNDNNITITLKGNDHFINAIATRDDRYAVTFSNVTYWGANGIENTGNAVIYGSSGAAGQNFSVMLFVDDALVLDEVMVTDENGMIVLDVRAGDNYYISVRHEADSYFPGTEDVVSIAFNVNVTSQVTDTRTVNITAKSDIPHGLAEGKFVFLVPDADPIVATYAGNGTWWALHTFAECGEFEVNASVVGVDNVTVNNATITVNMTPTQLAANPVTATYNANQYLVITLTDAYANPLSNMSVSVDLGGVKAYVTDANGQIKISTKALAAKAYNAIITFNGNAFYVKSSKTVKVTVNKAANTLKVKAKTAKVKFSKLKKKAQRLKVTKVVRFIKKGQGTMFYKKVKGNKKIVINKRTGKVTIKKGLKKGTYKVRMKIKAKGNANYKASAYKTITFKIKIK